MYKLKQFAQADPQWTLEQMVEIANDLLPQLLPEKEVNQKVHEEVNPRLVRHYTTLELIEKPIKEGREARYTYRHLLQLLTLHHGEHIKLNGPSYRLRGRKLEWDEPAVKEG